MTAAGIAICKAHLDPGSTSLQPPLFRQGPGQHQLLLPIKKQATPHRGVQAGKTRSTLHFSVFWKRPA